MTAFGALRSRLAGRTPAEIVRSVSLRYWPFSAVTRAYYGLRFWPPVWNQLINRTARTAFAECVEALDPIQQRVVTELRNEGISVLRVDDLLGAAGAFDRLSAAATPFLLHPDVRAQISSGASEGRRGKYFVVRAFDETPMIDLENPLMALPLEPRVLAIVNSYFGMLSRLKSLELWINLPVDPASPVAGSQTWHRDYEDRQLLKIFVYLTDVTADAGPLSFVRTSHSIGALGDLFPRRPPRGVVPPAGAVESAVPVELVTTCTVPAGTIVFCDTSGLHKGGRCERLERRVFTATFGTHGAIDPDRYRRPSSAQARHLSRAARHALGMSAPPSPGHKR